MTGREENYPHDERDDLDDPRLRETARLVRHVMHTDQMRPAFRDQLRAEIVAARAEVIRDAGRPAAPQSPVPQSPVPQHSVPQPTVPQQPAPQHTMPQRPTVQRPPVQRPISQRPPSARPAPRPTPRRRGLRRAGWLGAATVAAAAAVVFAVLGLPTLLNATGPVTVAIRSDVTGNVSADPAAAVRLRFTQPLDRAATRAAVTLRPFTDTSAEWDGDTLVVKAAHGFAPNTGYLLTIDHTVARTAKGAALAADLHLVFGTALLPGVGPEPPATLPLHRTLVAAVEDGSEAVVARDGSLLLTEAQAGSATGNRRGLVRVGAHGAERLSGNAAAICVSRSGDSIAYLADTGADTQVVFANSLGTPLNHRHVDVDAGSPLGWIDDERVTYVSNGELVAIDRDGNKTDLHTAVNAKDAFVIAPGGRYAYIEKQGVVRLGGDHPTLTRRLTGIAGEPAFSADGATVVWIDNSTGTPRLVLAPSAGGPVFIATLKGVGAGDQIDQLSVSPDGSHLVYTLASGSRRELRLASLPDGDTLAVSTEGAGQSPNWAPSGRMFTILDTHGSPHIESVVVPQALRDRGAAIEATARAFANAQLSGDSGAQRALAVSGVTLPTPAAAPTRAAVVWVVENADGTTQARVRLTVDPTIGHPAAVQAEETLTLGVPQGSVLPRVLKVSGGQSFTAAPTGPQLVHLDTDAVPGSLLLTFDSDLDQASLKAISLSGGLESRAAYDAQTRVVTLKAKSTGRLTIRIGTDLRDAKGNPLAESSTVDLKVTVQR